MKWSLKRIFKKSKLDDLEFDPDPVQREYYKDCIFACVDLKRFKILDWKRFEDERKANIYMLSQDYIHKGNIHIKYIIFKNEYKEIIRFFGLFSREVYLYFIHYHVWTWALGYNSEMERRMEKWKRLQSSENS
jgi:hypothetical protein